MSNSDEIWQYLYSIGVKDVFTIPGGHIMYLIDALERSSINLIHMHHEQACAIAAEAYARITGRLGVCLVTTGPGSTNALSAIGGAWVDSIPVLVISGQVRVPHIANYSKQRQKGMQEINIIDMARPVTKWAKTVMPEDDVLDELKIAINEALADEPGPVWLNIPLDLQ